MDPKARVIWGARVDPNMNGAIRIMLLITGVKSDQMLGNSTNRFLKNSFSKNSSFPSLADEFFSINEIRSINEENLNLF
ncbi:MAG: hypothetical protein ACTSPA_14940 [Promethearchaeota archaeon]